LVLVVLLVSMQLVVTLRLELLAQTVFLIVLLPMVVAAGAQEEVLLLLLEDQVVVGAMKVQEQLPEMAQQVKGIMAVMDMTQVLVPVAAAVGVLVQ
jgi:hypothetical protein